MTNHTILNKIQIFQNNLSLFKRNKKMHKFIIQSSFEPDLSMYQL